MVAVPQINDLVAYQQLIKEKKKVAIFYWAAWSGPSRLVTPTFHKHHHEEFPDITFITVDMDQATEILESEEIRVAPTFRFFCNGQKVGEVFGANTNELQKRLQELNNY